MRVRERHDVRDVPIHLTWDGYLPLTYPSVTYSRYEHIAEGARIRGATGRWLRPVLHSRHSSSLKDAQGYYAASDHSVFVTVHDYLPPLTPETLYEAMPLPDQASVRQHALEAFNDFSAQVPTEVSIANFTWELREIGQLLPKISGNLSEDVASGFLNYNFGWAPLLGDLKKLGGILNTVQSRIQYLRDTYGKRTRVAYYRKDFYVPGGSLDHEFYYYDTSPWTLRRDKYRADFRANGYMYHELQGLDDAWTLVRGMVGALGLNNPLQIVWNALPFSFVADWLGRFGAQFERFALKPFVGEWTIADTTHSINEYCKFRVLQNFHHAGNPEVDCGWIAVHRYQRGIGLPIELSLETFGGLTVDQQKLLLALSVGQMKH